MPKLLKFLAAYDIHWGYLRIGGHKKALHDDKAIGCMLKFAADFRPDVFILGGDGLDCGVISHHHKGKPGATEGLKLLADATEFGDQVLRPIEALKPKELVYITGNHEDWLNQFVEEHPTLEGIVDLETILKLKGWKVIPQGGHYNLGKLTFLHGDQISGGMNAARKAVIDFERSVRFGHYHTHSVFTKCSPLDAKNAKTGVIVPCLCRKDPPYMKGKPNTWLQGFNWGYVGAGGMFQDYVQIIIDGKTTSPDGKEIAG
jgi:hypothetical protein